jgi:hypothetical protein
MAQFVFPFNAGPGQKLKAAQGLPVGARPRESWRGVRGASQATGLAVGWSLSLGFRGLRSTGPLLSRASDEQGDRNA